MFKINKYNFNQLVLGSSIIAIISNLFWITLEVEASLIARVIQFSVSVVSLHYLCNIVHLASHNLLSKNKKLNHLLGIIASVPVLIFTFVDFKVTHLQHHKHATSPDNDPDYKITNNGTMMTLPFRILWYKDGFFAKFVLSKKRYSEFLEYLVERVFQVAIFGHIITESIVYGKNSLAHFFVVPLIIVGLGYAGYVYYYPHYQNYVEKFLRRSNSRFVRLIGSPFLWSIDLSRVIHHKHHDKISDNSCYYPEFWLWYNTFYNLPETFESKFLVKN